MQFENAVIRLCKSWFDGEEPDETTLLLQKFVFDGGVYGNRENLSCVRIAQSGGKLRYMVSRIFLPYSELKHEYPVLQKKKYLFPFYTLYRWLGFVFKSNKQLRLKNLKAVNNASDEKSVQTAELLEKIGL